MKRLLKILLNDYIDDGLFRDEKDIVLFAIVVPIAFIALCFLADFISNQY